MKTIKAFLYGMYEFKLMCTYRYDDPDLRNAFEWGREWAHRLTFRIWDQ